MCAHIIIIFKIEGFHIIHALGFVEAIRKAVNSDNPLRAFHPGELLGHQANGPTAQYGYRISRFNTGIFDTPVGGRKNIG
ncbi:hypothetical protein D3C76_1244920 [compost metagenome]